MSKYEIVIPRSLAFIFRLSLGFQHLTNLAGTLDLPTGGKTTQNPTSACISDSLSNTD